LHNTVDISIRHFIVIKTVSSAQRTSAAPYYVKSHFSAGDFIELAVVEFVFSLSLRLLFYFSLSHRFIIQIK